MRGYDLPRDNYARQNNSSRGIRHGAGRPKFLTKPFRKCPRCKQDTVATNIKSDKVILECKKCQLKYELTRYPAFEEIDYYNKMLDTYRSENWKRQADSDKSEQQNK